MGTPKYLLFFLTALSLGCEQGQPEFAESPMELEEVIREGHSGVCKKGRETPTTLWRGAIDPSTAPRATGGGCEDKEHWPHLWGLQLLRQHPAGNPGNPVLLAAVKLSLLGVWLLVLHPSLTCWWSREHR